MPPTGRRPAKPSARPTARPHAKPAHARTQKQTQDKGHDTPRGGGHGGNRDGAHRTARPHGPRRDTPQRAATAERTQYNPADYTPTERGASEQGETRRGETRRGAGGRPNARTSAPSGARANTRPDARSGTRSDSRPNALSGTRTAARPDTRHNGPGNRTPQAKTRGPRNAGNPRHDKAARTPLGQATQDMLAAPPPRPVPTEPLPVLYQDRHVVIVNKPAGLPVHPGPRGGLCVEDWFPLLSRRADGPWLVHRLDADTAGCLAIALRKQPLVAMQQAFANHTAQKTYWAIVRNGPKEETGRIDLPLVRENTPTGWHMRPEPKPKPADAGKTAATTLWRVLGRGKGLCWLELTLLSGRTHQARVHCAAMGWPIVGDTLYGTADAQGLHLLAQGLSLPLEPVVTVTAPPPASMQGALRACGWKPDQE